MILTRGRFLGLVEETPWKDRFDFLMKHYGDNPDEFRRSFVEFFAHYAANMCCGEASPGMYSVVLTGLLLLAKEEDADLLIRGCLESEELDDAGAPARDRFAREKLRIIPIRTNVVPETSEYEGAPFRFRVATEGRTLDGDEEDEDIKLFLDEGTGIDNRRREEREEGERRVKAHGRRRR